MQKYLIWTFLCGMLCTGSSAIGQTLRLYIDADFSISTAGSRAIALGVNTALAEVGGTVGGYTIEVVESDHRKNTKRSERLFQRFADDPDGLAVIGGVQSPPYLALRDHINAQGLLTLLPWSAAGPVTRPVGDAEGYIFRLSVDDWKAGPFLVEDATQRIGCESIGLMTTDTGWGRSNRSIMRGTLATQRRYLPIDLQFSPSLGPATAEEIANQIVSSDADCMILIGGMPAGGLLLSALADLPDRPRVVSHWGILSGAFPQAVPEAQRDALGLRILQTCGLQAEVTRPDRFREVLATVDLEGNPVARVTDIPGYAGFVHGYDVTLLLLAALEQAMADTTFDRLSPMERRDAVREALLNLETPVDGLLQVYQKPFAPIAEVGADGHEALGLEDLCMTMFDGDTLVPAMP